MEKMSGQNEDGVIGKLSLHPSIDMVALMSPSKAGLIPSRLRMDVNIYRTIQRGTV